MIDVKQAVKKAREVIKELYQDQEISNIGLEEVTLDEEHNEWLVTIGYDYFRKKIHAEFSRVMQTQMLNPLKVDEKLGEQTREYKILRLNADDGHFNGMKIRQFN